MLLGAASALSTSLPATSRPAPAPPAPAGARVDADLAAAAARDPAAPLGVIIVLRVAGPEQVAEVRRAVLRRLAPAGFRPTHAYHALPLLAGRLVASTLGVLARDPGVRAVGLDAAGSGGLSSSVPFIHADRVQAQGGTGRGARVAVLDSGIDADHPDFAGRVVGEACFVSLAPGCPAGPHAADDDSGHGTSVAGVIASAGAVAPRGVAPEAELVAVKVLDSRNRLIMSDVLAGLDWLVGRRDIRAVNLSLGSDALFPGACDRSSAWAEALALAVGTLRAQGTLSVVASLNNGSGTHMSAPACLEQAIAVGAVYDGAAGARRFGACEDRAALPDHVACFSNGNQMLDLLAPGVEIASSGLRGGASVASGTSQAAPHVTGAVALLAGHPGGLAPGRIERVLRLSGVAVADPRNGLTRPRIDVARAMEAAGGGEAYLPALWQDARNRRSALLRRSRAFNKGGT